MPKLKIAAATILIVVLISLSTVSLASVAMAKQDNSNGKNGNSSNNGTKGNGGNLSASQSLSNQQGQRLGELKNVFKKLYKIVPHVSSNLAEFVSTSSGGNISAFALTVHAQGVPSISIAIVNVTSDGQNVTAQRLSASLKLFGLEEYEDTNGNGVFDNGNDTGLQWVNFAPLDWSLRAAPETVNGVGGWLITLTALDHGANYTVSIDMFNTGVTLKDGTPVGPTEAKINFSFVGFPWKANDSRLALVADFTGEGSSAQMTHADNQTEVVTYRDSLAYFTWASTATVDGSTTPVAVSSVGDQGVVRHLQLNYPNGKEIVHDPVIGVASGSLQDVPSYQIPPSSPAAPVVLELSTLFLAAFVLIAAAALAFAARRNLLEPRLQMRYISPPMTSWPFIKDSR